MRKKTSSTRDDTVREIVDSIAEFTAAFEKTEDTVGKIMRKHIDGGSDVISIGGSLSLSEYHVLHQIGLGDERGSEKFLANGVRIAGSTGMTRGGVSKITAKLRGKGLILSERIPDNQKEVYYRLTGDGEKLFALHAKLHDIAYKNITRVVAEYGEDEMIIIRGFLKKVISAVGALSWENLKVLRDL